MDATTSTVTTRTVAAGTAGAHDPAGLGLVLALAREIATRPALVRPTAVRPAAAPAAALPAAA